MAEALGTGFNSIEQTSPSHRVTFADIFCKLVEIVECFVAPLERQHYLARALARSRVARTRAIASSCGMRGLSLAMALATLAFSHAS